MTMFLQWSKFIGVWFQWLSKCSICSFPGSNICFKLSWSSKFLYCTLSTYGEEWALVSGQGRQMSSVKSTPTGRTGYERNLSNISNCSMGKLVSDGEVVIFFAVLLFQGMLRLR